MIPIDPPRELIPFIVAAVILMILVGSEIGGAMVMLGKRNRQDDPPGLGERLEAGCMATYIFLGAVAAFLIFAIVWKAVIPPP